MKKPTQKQIIFYRLLYNKGKGNEYIPVHELMGEHEIHPLGTWGFVSYEVSARLSELNKQNPNLLEWKMITGRSGARYRAYRIRENATREDIDSPRLKAFFTTLLDNAL